MASDILDRVAMVITDTSTGDVTANVLISNRFNTPQEAGAQDGKSYWWMLEEGTDYQIFEGVWTLSGTKVARTTSWQSKILGVHGNANMDLKGNATLRSITPAEVFDCLLRVDRSQSFNSTQKAQGRENIGAPVRDLSLVGGNLNGITETGSYYADSSTSNIPSPASYWMVDNFYFSVNPAYGYQLATSVNLSPTQRWLRQKTAGVWQAWQRIVTTADATVLTFQKILSGSGTYVTPADVKWIRVIGVAGGGGGCGSGVTGGGGTSGGGGNTTFGTSLLVAAGGGGVAPGTGNGGGGGGGASLGTVAIGTITAGGSGGGNGQTNSSAAAGAWPGGMGGTSRFGGSPITAWNAVGQDGPTNTGVGGSGAGIVNNGGASVNGGGGGGGGSFEAIILAPAATYNYAVGAGGAAGIAGSGGAAGGAGGSGGIWIEEHYGN